MNAIFGKVITLSQKRKLSEKKENEREFSRGGGRVSLPDGPSYEAAGKYPWSIAAAANLA